MTTFHHPIVTRDYPENISGGIMVCGINFGYSKEDEALEGQVENVAREVLSFFSDETVNKTKFRDRALRWLRSLGIKLSGTAGGDGALEKSVFQTNWFDSQTRDIGTAGEFNSKAMVEIELSLQEQKRFGYGLISVVEARKPRAIIFFGANLIEAFNDIRLRPRIEASLGPRSGNAQRIGLKTDTFKGKVFSVRYQTFGSTYVVCLPHPQAHGVTDEFIASLAVPEEVMACLRRVNSDQI